MWFFKITKVAPFKSVKVFRKDSFLALVFSLFSSMIFLFFCLFPSAALFILTTWSLGPPPPRSLLLLRLYKKLCFDYIANLSTGVFLSIQENVRRFSSHRIPTKLTSSPTPSYLPPPLRFSCISTFLGVIFNRTLSFSKHVFLLKVKFFSRLKALRCISASLWGPFKESISLPFKAFLWPLLTNASTGWFPFLSVTNVSKLERLKQAASRVITDCLSYAPISLRL